MRIAERAEGKSKIINSGMNTPDSKRAYCVGHGEN